MHHILDIHVSINGLTKYIATIHIPYPLDLARPQLHQTKQNKLPTPAPVQTPVPAPTAAQWINTNGNGNGHNQGNDKGNTKSAPLLPK